MLMVVLAAILTLGLTGCVIPTTRELTEEQEEVITEYAAGLIKKYDKSFSEQLLTDEELEAAIKAEEEEKAKEERKQKLAEEYLAKVEANEKKKQEEKAAKNKEKSEGNDASGESVVAGPVSLDGDALETYFQTEGLSISYKGFDVVDSYPEGDSSFFGVEADAGKKIVVVNLGISNNTGDDIFLDMFSEQNRYSLNVNGVTIPSDSTVLLNDFSMYKDTVAAGSGIDTVLLFEVPQDSAIAQGDSSGALIEINGGKGQAVIDIN